MYNIREISKKVLEHYPDDVNSLSNLGVSHLVLNEYNEGLEYLLKAETLSPKDSVILENIAQTYGLMGNKKKSLEYYEKLYMIGDETTKKEALNHINELRK